MNTNVLTHIQFEKKKVPADLFPLIAKYRRHYRITYV